MKFKTILNIFFSILIGLYFPLYHTLFAGMSYFLTQILSAFVFLICILNIVSIYREPNKKIQIIQFIILFLAIIIGLYKANSIADSYNQENPRIYYQKETN